nr:MAG TPA: hypothetical protein [Crassvirales sp.]
MNLILHYRIHITIQQQNFQYHTYSWHHIKVFFHIFLF